MGTSNARTGRTASTKESKPTNRERPLEAGSKILAAINEATQILRAEGLKSPRLTIREYKLPEEPPAYGSADVKRVRERLGMSQAVIAGFLGININTLRSWEQGKRVPQPIACRFLAEIESDVPRWRLRILKEMAPNKSER